MFFKFVYHYLLRNGGGGGEGVLLDVGKTCILGCYLVGGKLKDAMFSETKHISTQNRLQNMNSCYIFDCIIIRTYKYTSLFTIWLICYNNG